MSLGDRCDVGGFRGTVLYIGTVDGYGSQIYAGIEWDDPSRGKHDGLVKGRRYFQTRIPNSGSLVKIENVQFPLDIYTEIQSRYGDEDSGEPDIALKISSKVVELIGMEKTARKQSDFHRLVNIVLDGRFVGKAPTEEIRPFSACRELNLHGNLLHRWDDVRKIVKLFPNVKELVLRQNRMDDIQEENSTISTNDLIISTSVIRLSISECNLKDESIEPILNCFPVATEIVSFINNLSFFNPGKDASERLTVLDLEMNPLKSLDSIRGEYSKFIFSKKKQSPTGHLEWSLEEIVKKLKVSRVLVFRTAQRYRRLGTSDDMQRSGRPVTVTTPEAVKAVREKIRRTPERSLLAGTKDGSHLTTLFTDEKIFTVEANNNGQNHPIIATDYQSACEKEKILNKTSHPASVMVFSGITADDKTPLIFVDSGVKGVALSQFSLRKPTMDLPARRRPRSSCQRDSRVLSRQFSEFISAADWPASSPDLNPMDYAVWIYLTEKVSSKNYPSIKALKTALIKKWDEIDDDYPRAVIDALRKLSVAECGITSLYPLKGSRFPKLENLNLKRNEITEWKSISALQSLPSLQILHIDCPNFTTEPGIPPHEVIVAKLSSVIELNRFDISEVERRSAEIRFLSKYWAVREEQRNLDHLDDLNRFLKAHGDPVPLEVPNKRLNVMTLNIKIGRKRVKKSLPMTVSVQRIGQLIARMFGVQDEPWELFLQNERCERRFALNNPSRTLSYYEPDEFSELVLEGGPAWHIEFC
ncbi:unnamed protein product [Caenorhabditis auriculariae]|uniref:Tubulin-specific chaperone E n=1 Tax=Caenorhabditis auriculariae TaxID=2777116 RepID=A0A8S1HVN0_9PELO|nr:unnamed protein product [Caenorhabditis auriculariae]